ncbi:hypothetical protein TNIN_230161 [Trichonephila inaurata madagascariensis]|uniref:Uncharacterized protein n=1 Tax=Trichonephila inaurata madagascariensis TaxID=2747483 RepID=A0A8X6XEH7_9ARAC|nr:hypothetical protein TNIN_230161 [Trichonephila inaurata madagascariensis]
MLYQVLVGIAGLRGGFPTQARSQDWREKKGRNARFWARHQISPASDRAKRPLHSVLRNFPFDLFPLGGGIKPFVKPPLRFPILPIKNEVNRGGEPLLPPPWARSRLIDEVFD